MSWKEFEQDRIDGFSTFLSLLYVLRALSIVVSLFGMVNTQVLSVFERTRELGMLRAVGMSRRQTRRMIRHESVITGLIGAALGLPLGLALAALVTQALSKYDVQFAVRRQHSSCSRSSPFRRASSQPSAHGARRGSTSSTRFSTSEQVSRGRRPESRLPRVRPRKSGIDGILGAIKACHRFAEVALASARI
jgi:ABC-type antimicrobial peptide transport system permease subunit